jgi:threonine/homoserine/homoserine lactone efflux protein
MRVLEFAVAATIAEITPGPNMGYLVALSLAQGRRAGLAAVAGVALGLSLLGVAAALGFGLLTQQVPYAGEVLRWAGIAFLFWLAVEAWRGIEDVSEGEIAPSFRRGLIVNLLNPKAAMFYVAVLPLFLHPADAVLAPQLWLTGLYVIIATAVHAGLVLGASSLRGVFVDRKRLVIFQRGAAILMGCVALWFAWETRL